ncbi:MAG: hypothetical protein HOY69_22850 [Streptomyces sp.]|nr:hypothetical protein [Streptomyces sp.]
MPDITGRSVFDKIADTPANLLRLKPAARVFPRAEIGGSTISTRKILAAIAVASAALALTACGPDDPAATDTGSPTAAAKSPSPKASQAGDSCPTLAPGHTYIWVNYVEGAMNNVIARKAEAQCDPKMNEGAAYHPVGPVKTYAFSLDAKVTVIGKNGPEARGEKPGTDTGIGHVKTCADPDGKTYDGGQAPKTDEYCYGQNYYDVVLDGDTITQMTEVYGS